MIQEEKQLLLKDLCARVPYGVKIEGYKLPCIILNSDWLHFMCTHQEFSIRRPYLRPMSSMTEEERVDFYKVGGLMSHKVETDTYVLTAFSPEAYDWLNAHNFDYRGLIEKGLALEAPDGMYNIKKK